MEGLYDFRKNAQPRIQDVPCVTLTLQVQQRRKVSLHMRICSRRLHGDPLELNLYTRFLLDLVQTYLHQSMYMISQG